MITIENPEYNDLEKCIEIYYNYNDNNFIEVDKNKSILQLREKWKSGEILLIIKNNKEIVGWLLASVNKQPFSKKVFLQQLFYVSNLNGFKSAKAILLSHSELIRIAEKRNVDIVLSTGSFYDESNVFSKILEKRGWNRRGHTAIWKTSHYKDNQ
jgi:hypothetical protein